MTYNFWAEAISKAVGREPRLPAPSIPQTPAEPEQRVNADDYLAKAREAIPKVQGVSVEERLSTVEYVRPDGSKYSVAGRDDSDITVRRQDNASWETNSRRVKTDNGLFGDEVTPQQYALAHQMAMRDGAYGSSGDYSAVGNTPWARQQMVNDAISAGEFTDAGHGDGGAFDQTSAARTGWTPFYRG